MSTSMFGRFAHFRVFSTFQPRYVRPLPQPAIQLFGSLDLFCLKHSRLFSVYNVVLSGCSFLLRSDLAASAGRGQAFSERLVDYENINEWVDGHKLAPIRRKKGTTQKRMSLRKLIKKFVNTQLEQLKKINNNWHQIRIIMI